MRKSSKGLATPLSTNSDGSALVGMVSRYLFESHQIPEAGCVKPCTEQHLLVPGLFLLIPNDFIYIHLYFPKYVVK